MDSKIKYPEAGQAKTVAQLMHPEGQWNTFRLVAKGTEFTVWINGQPASHYTDAKFAGPAPLVRCLDVERRHIDAGQRHVAPEIGRVALQVGADDGIGRGKAEL